MSSESAAAGAGVRCHAHAGAYATAAPASLGSAPAAGGQPKWPLVGRDGLLEQVEAALRRPGLHAVLLHGPAGVGKTRLAQECATRLEGAYPVFRITATRSLAAVPLGPLAGLLTLGEVDLDPLTTDAVRLFAHARRVVADLAGGARLLLLVDDLPRLDPLSLGVLVQLLEEGLAVLLATARSGEALPDAVLAMWSADRALRVDVPLLTARECGELIATTLGGPVAAQAVEAFARESGGNALHLRELVSETSRRGGFTSVSGVWQLTGPVTGSPALLELLRLRLDGLDAAGRSVVERLALCQTLDVDELVEPAARSALAALEENGIVTVEPGANDAAAQLLARLAHPQYESVVRTGISRLRAADLLLQQVAVVEARPPRRGDPLRVALWRLEATGTADPDLLLRASRLARLAHDFVAVERLAGAAARSWREHGPGLAESLLHLGEAECELGRPDDAARTLREAAGMPAADDVRARVAALRAGLLADEGTGGVDAAIALLDEAQAAVPGQAAALAAARAEILRNAYRAHEALVAVTTVPAPTRPGDRLEWSVAASVALAWAGRAREGVELAEESTSAMSRLRGAALLHSSAPELARTAALIQDGRVEDATKAAHRALAYAVQDGLDRAVTVAEWTLTMALLHAGRPRSASRWARDVVSGGQAHGPRRHVCLGLAGLALAHAWLGEPGPAREALGRIPASGDPDEPWRVLAGCWARALEGDLDGATGDLRDRADRALDAGHPTLAAALLHGVVRLGRPGLVVDRLERLQASTEGVLTAAFARHATAAARRDVAGLSASADEFERIGSRMSAAEAAAQAAQAAAGTASKREVAALTARARQLAGRCEGGVLHALLVESVSPLTDREREISRLAARGMSSREIAERLFLSVRTVNNHLQAAYTKLGIGSRRELAEALSA
ncbi:LuxR C-terminal-related transcriptional regulator [Motilibacter aurantiacus]|uniref:LuxR C-terminal-related transcriptional regulator n=1 Tax=Motilibacter aurantiacus TaxID=2714955 RepID=UPI00140E89C3|nr:AAA family ATPase [Motilibacter aurantiacus]